MAALHQDQQPPAAVVTHNMFSAQKIADDLQEALSPDQVLLYPANELVAAESAVSSPRLWRGGLMFSSVVQEASGYCRCAIFRRASPAPLPK